MGSRLRLTLPGRDERGADLAWSIVAGTFGRVERDLTRFDPESALSRLNRSVGRLVHVPPTLSRALALAWRAFRVSDGRFDPRIIGALEEAGERAGVELPPSPAVLRATDRWLWLEPRAGRARLDAPVDLGGIGKGLALRWTARCLRRAGFADFLVGAGGDLVASGVGPARRAWSVALDPAGAGGAAGAAIVLSDGGALATSSVAVRWWEAPDGTRRHHLIDPASGRPADPAWWSVTVAAPDPAWAEVMSKVGLLAGDRIGQVLAGRRAWWFAPPAGSVQCGGRRSMRGPALPPSGPQEW